jgi:hypothetical protein
VGKSNINKSNYRTDCYGYQYEPNRCCTASELRMGKEWITVQEDMATIFAPEETKNG